LVVILSGAKDLAARQILRFAQNDRPMRIMMIPLVTAHKARRLQRRRAFNLLEMVAVLAIVALLAAAGVTRFGSGTLENVGAEGFARKLALDLLQARRRTIATGDNHYLQLTVAGSNVTSYVMYRRASGGDVVVEEMRTVPAGVTVATSATTLEFDFSGASLAAYTITVNGPNRTWTVSTVMATGAVRTAAS
jgi:prepilin-type N-terminal cleavage/methylation domain-containing protein